MKYVNTPVNKTRFIETDLSDVLPFKKLDEILKYILNADKPPFRSFSEIQKNATWEVESKELMEILDKLVKDGFIREETSVRQVNGYYSTFEGRIFFTESGGYMRKIEADYQAQIRHDQNENRKVTNEKKLILATRLAGIAGLLLFLMEVVKFLYQITNQSHS